MSKEKVSQIIETNTVNGDNTSQLNSVGIDLSKTAPNQLVEFAGAEFAQGFNSETNTVEALPLKRFVAPVLNALFANSILLGMTNTRAVARGVGSVEYTFAHKGFSQAKGDQKDFNRGLREKNSFKRLEANTLREWIYNAANYSDYELSEKENLFNVFIGGSLQAIRTELEKEAIFKLGAAAPLDQTTNNTIDLINDVVGTDEPAILKQFRDDLAKLKTFGAGYKNYSEAARTITGLQSGNAVKGSANSDAYQMAFASVDTVVVGSAQFTSKVAQTEAFNIFGAGASMNVFSGGMVFRGHIDGVAYVENVFFGRDKINYVLFPIGERSPLGTIFVNNGVAFDRMPGSPTDWLYNQQYRYGIDAIEPLNDLIFINGSDNYVKFSGIVSEKLIGQTTIDVEGAFKLGTGESITSATIEAYALGDIQGTATPVTTVAATIDGTDFTGQLTGLTANSLYTLAVKATTTTLTDFYFDDKQTQTKP